MGVENVQPSVASGIADFMDMEVDMEIEVQGQEDQQQEVVLQGEAAAPAGEEVAGGKDADDEDEKEDECKDVDDAVKTDKDVCDGNESAQGAEKEAGQEKHLNTLPGNNDGDAGDDEAVEADSVQGPDDLGNTKRPASIGEGIMHGFHWYSDVGLLEKYIDTPSDSDSDNSNEEEINISQEIHKYFLNQSKGFDNTGANSGSLLGHHTNSDSEDIDSGCSTHDSFDSQLQFDFDDFDMTLIGGQEESLYQHDERYPAMQYSEGGPCPEQGRPSTPYPTNHLSGTKAFEGCDMYGQDNTVTHNAPLSPVLIKGNPVWSQDQSDDSFDLHKVGGHPPRINPQDLWDELGDCPKTSQSGMPSQFDLWPSQVFLPQSHLSRSYGPGPHVCSPVDHNPDQFKPEAEDEIPDVGATDPDVGINEKSTKRDILEPELHSTKFTSLLRKRQSIMASRKLKKDRSSSYSYLRSVHHHKTNKFKPTKKPIQKDIPLCKFHRSNHFKRLSRFFSEAALNFKAVECKCPTPDWYRSSMGANGKTSAKTTMKGTKLRRLSEEPASENTSKDIGKVTITERKVVFSDLQGPLGNWQNWQDYLQPL